MCVYDKVVQACGHPQPGNIKYYSAAATRWKADILLGTLGKQVAARGEVLSPGEVEVVVDRPPHSFAAALKHLESRMGQV